MDASAELERSMTSFKRSTTSGHDSGEDSRLRGGDATFQVLDHEHLYRPDNFLSAPKVPLHLQKLENGSPIPFSGVDPRFEVTVLRGKQPAMRP